MKKLIFYSLFLLFLLVGCSVSKPVYQHHLQKTTTKGKYYQQKRNLMILGIGEQPRNKALKDMKKRHKRNMRKIR
jgi:hypothetical protein